MKRLANCYCWVVVSLSAAIAIVVALVATAPRWRAHVLGPPAYHGGRISDQAEMILRGHTRAVNRVAFSPEGARIVSAGGDGDATVKGWEGTTGRELLSLAGDDRGGYNG